MKSKNIQQNAKFLDYGLSNVLLRISVGDVINSVLIAT